MNQQCMNLFQTLTGGVQVGGGKKKHFNLHRKLDAQCMFCSTPGLLYLIVKLRSVTLDFSHIVADFIICKHRVPLSGSESEREKNTHTF